MSKIVQVTLRPDKIRIPKTLRFNEGFVILSIQNAIAVIIGKQRFSVGARLSTEQAEELNSQAEVEVTVVPR